MGANPGRGGDESEQACRGRGELVPASEHDASEKAQPIVWLNRRLAIAEWETVGPSAHLLVGSGSHVLGEEPHGAVTEDEIASSGVVASENASHEIIGVVF